ncbi:hypothetical protein IFM89_038974, partial [Coptis chinensis]
HTGVVVYGNEYYFGGGIQSMPQLGRRPTEIQSSAYDSKNRNDSRVKSSFLKLLSSVAEVPVKSVGDFAKASEKLSTLNDTKTITKKSTVGAPKKKVDGVAGDPLGNARSKIQEWSNVSLLQS